MRSRLNILLMLTTVFVLNNTWSQNFDGINVQLQTDHNYGGSIDAGVLLLNAASDTIWYEIHSGISISEENTFTLFVGQGTYISGLVSTFEDVNWNQVNEVHFVNDLNSDLIGVFESWSVPYALHSKWLETVPNVGDLSDVQNGPNSNSFLLKYDGTSFYFSEDLVADTVLFAWYANQSSTTDTAGVAVYFLPPLVDTVEYAYVLDSTNFAQNTSNSDYADSTSFADTADYVNTALNNWNIYGNQNVSASNFIGTTTNSSLSMRTNNQDRIILDDNVFLNNTSGVSGFHVDGNRGVLFDASGASSHIPLQGTYAYFNGEMRAMGFGTHLNPFITDTIQGIYSFHFGNNVKAAGSYATVFGLNSYADSTAALNNPQNAVVFGRNSRAARNCVAIGDSCIAGFYRNVAIGRNVIASDNSSAVGFGRNVISTGITSWAAGLNVTADGHFSTALGTNASNNGFAGSFVYGDASTSNIVNNTADQQFMVRSSGGVIFYTSSDLSTGVQISPGGGSWSMLSDRNRKRLILPIDYQKFEIGLSLLNIYSWTYIGFRTLHYGPMAQDVYHLFGVGEAANYINMIDADGLVLAGIKLVSNRTTSIEQNIQSNSSQIKDGIEQEKIENEKLKERLDKIYEKLDH